MVDIATLLARLASSPFTLLYTLRAVTYLVAGALSRRAGHHDLCLCYVASGFLNWGFAACHVFHME